MTSLPIIMPQLGESIAEAKVINLLVKPGDLVTADQNVMEVETNKATMTVTSPCNGHLSRWLAELDQSYAVGDTLGFVDITKEEAVRLGLPAAETPTQTAVSKHGVATGEPTRSSVQPTVRGLPVPANAQGAGYISPRMKARMQELGLHAADLAGVAGSGAGGRLTVEDFEKFIASLEHNRTSPASSMRIAVADAMRRSTTRPLATVGLPVCIDALLAHRKTCNPRPGPTLYALRALAIALSENSAPAGRLIGTQIVHPSAIDIGFAVEAEDGVLVPVLRHVDKMRLVDLIQPYENHVDLARKRQLPAGATGGSIATVTNFGTFGLTWATPIPLPEQTLVLGMGAGRRVPSWSDSEQKFVPVTEACLTLSFDHRVIDGGAAGRLLSRIASLMNSPGSL